MKKFLLFIAIVWIAGCSPKQENSDMANASKMDASHMDSCCAVKDGLFIHISSGYDNPHKVLMALKMGKMMSMHKAVAIYLDIEAVKLVLKDSKEMKFADFPTLKELLKELTDAKVLIMACPTCLKIAGKTEADLIPGVILADKDKFFDFTKGRILSLDY